MVDWVTLKERQRQIDEDVKRIKEQQRQQFISKSGGSSSGSSSKKRLTLTPEEQKKVSILYTGEDRIDIKPGSTAQQAEQQVRQRRAEDIVKRVQVKETVKALGMPEGYTVETSRYPTKLDVTPVTRQEVVKDTTYKDKEFITPGFERRIETLLEREKRLDVFKQEIYEHTGLEKTPEQEKFKLQVIRQDIFGKSIPVGISPTKESLVGLGKTIGQFPVELATLPPFIGGRVGFIGESLFSDVGKKELSRAKKETPKVVAQSYNPKTTSGLFNIGFTLVGIGRLGKARSVARQKIKFTKESVGISRITGKYQTIDTSYIDVEAMLGKKVEGYKGRASQSYENLLYHELPVKEGVTYSKITGKAELTGLENRKVIKIDLEGFGEASEAGVKTWTTSEVRLGKKTTNYLSYTETAPLLKEPSQVWKWYQTTQEIKLGKIKGTEIIAEPKTTIGKISPYEEAIRLQAKDKLDISFGDLGEGVMGEYVYKYNLKTYKILSDQIIISDFYNVPELATSKTLFKDFESTIAHEMAHKRTPKLAFLQEVEGKLNIPYKYQPTEIIARVGEHRPFISKKYGVEFVEKPYDITYIKEMKPATFSAGTTGELYVEQLFPEKIGESMFKKTVKGELGTPIAIEQTLVSEGGGISFEEFTKRYESTPRVSDLSRTFKERESFRPVTSETPSGTTVTKQVLGLKGLPDVSGQIVLEVAKKQASLELRGYQKAQVKSSALIGGVLTSGLKFQVPKQTQQMYSMSTPDIKPVTKAGLTPFSSHKVETQVLPKLQESSIVRSRSVINTQQKPLIETKPLLEQKPLSSVYPILETKPIVSTKSKVAVKPKVSFKPKYRQDYGFRPTSSFTPQPTPTTPTPFIPPIIPLGEMYLPESTGKPSKALGKAKSKYTPSVEALVFDITTPKLTKSAKIQALTGLGTRPIKL